jgi:formylglycine-generating enzyme required for sulfatase activity
MGSDVSAAFPPDEDETPRRVVELRPFRLARTPVTVGQYAAFRGSPPTGDPQLPVTYVSLEDAHSFCAWAGVRLPTEDEWEAAARAGDDRLWPWGDELPTPERAVFAGPIGGPEPVGSRPAGASAHGVLDLAGNVHEWTDTGAVRGGSYLDGPAELRCARRLPLHPAAHDTYVGFRVVAGEAEARLRFDWVEIPGGEYAIGRDPRAFGGPVREDELPQHIVEVAPFELSLTPVTVGQYAAYAAEAGIEALDDGPTDHPVTLVDWFDARGFCEWTGGRLPTEAEWEKAARGADARRFPWGPDEDRDRALVGVGIKHGRTEPVGERPSGASPYGLLGMAGNVWEWVSSAHAPYPYDAGDGREDPAADCERVLRGGSFASPGLDHARCAMRSRSRPERRQRHIGFRVAR